MRRSLVIAPPNERALAGRAWPSPRTWEMVSRLLAAAQAVVDAAEQHAQDGIGAFSHNGKMVDAPIVERAQRVLRLHETHSR